LESFQAIPSSILNSQACFRPESVTKSLRPRLTVTCRRVVLMTYRTAETASQRGGSGGRQGPPGTLAPPLCFNREDTME